MIDWEKGIVNSGNSYPLKKAMERAAAGEQITVGFLGGSITQGSLSSSPETCYAYLVYQWWKNRFANVNYINAGIGGTTSQFGVARVKDDLLYGNPDVVFVEFSVNDTDNAHFQETYEGLIRNILKSGAACILIHNVCYDTGVSAERIHAEIGRHYNLPCVSIKPTIYQELLSGALENRAITPDDLHPNDKGHQMLAEAVKYLLETVYSMPADKSVDEVLPAALTANQYENSIRYQNHNSHPVLDGFAPDFTPQEHITQMFRNGFTAGKTGDSIVFWVDSTGIAVQYRKSVKKPAPIAEVYVDGIKSPVILDANFQEDWGDCLYIDTIVSHAERKMRKVEIRIAESHDDDAAAFYLVSVIGSK